MAIKRGFLAVALAATCLVAQPGVLAHELVEMPAPAADETLVHEFMLDGRRLTLRLEDNRAPFSRLESTVRSSMLEGGNRFFRGAITGLDDSWARLSWVDDAWSGAFFDGEELFILDRAPPGRTRDATSGSPNVAVYRLSELEFRDIDFGHPLEVQGHEHERPMRVIPDPRRRSHDGNSRLPVTIVSDTQFSANHGGDVLAVAAARINTIDGVLSAEVGTGLLLMHHEVLVDNGTLTADNCWDLREQFQDYFVDGNGSDIPFAGVAHLFTGRQLSGAVGCVTSTNFGPCTRPFSLAVVMDMPQEWQSIGVFAHELGHNLGAPHDAEPGSACEHEPPGRIMAPDGGTSLTYSDCSVGIMQQRLETSTCLVQPWLFRDGFEAH